MSRDGVFNSSEATCVQLDQTLRKISQLLREYLGHPSHDGSPQRQVLRNELARLLDECNLY